MATTKKKAVKAAPVARKKAQPAQPAKAAKAAGSKRPLNRRADGSVDAIAFLERLNGGPLTFGQMLQSVRKCDELSLDSMSAKLGITRGNLCDVEHGRRAVSAARAARWAQLLGYSADQFVALALQAELDREGLKLRVSVQAA